MKPLASLAKGWSGEAERAALLGYILVRCPHCEEPRKIEPDGFYSDVVCEACGKHYRTEGIA